MSMRSIQDVDLMGRTLLIRVDFNVPLDGERITDDHRIQSSLPTLRYALNEGAKLVVCAHLGKPKGQPKPEFSLAPVAARLAELLGQEVPLAPDCVGQETKAMAAGLKGGQIMMLQNLRYNPAEQSKDVDERKAFAKQLAALADIYVNDAFGVAHRFNASVTEVPLFSEQCCAGLLLIKEWEYLGEALSDPARPYVAVSGGAKVSTKLGILTNLVGKVDHIIIGGAMANTFLVAQGLEVGDSLIEPDLVDAAKDILAKAEGSITTVHLPVDFIYAEKFDADKADGTCAANAIPAGAMVLDIGPETLKQFNEVLSGAKTIVWNGPMGAFENPAFAEGSFGLARTMAELDALTIIGGGDTDAVIHGIHLADKFSFISTGGGSFLEFLEGKELPAFTALKECLDR